MTDSHSLYPPMLMSKPFHAAPGLPWLRCFALALCFLVAPLAGCKPVASMMTSLASAPKTSAQGSSADEANSSVMSDSVNYMHERGVKFTLYDLSTTPPTAIGGSIVEMLGTGGDKGCCLSLPKTWRPGIKLRLVWDEADREQTYPEKYTRDFEVPRYDEPADLYVVFYPKNEVEIVVSKGEPGHPQWKGRIKATPWENCLAQNERKVCKRATARFFDTASVGFCTYLKEENRPDQDDLCFTAMHQCMQDFEDEPFCKGILWGARKK